MTLPIELHPEAIEEGAEARRWYAERDVGAALGFVSALDDAIARIADSPLRWPQYLHDTRRLLTRRYPFAVVYRVFDDRVLVVAIAHQRRRPGYWAIR